MIEFFLMSIVTAILNVVVLTILTVWPVMILIGVLHSQLTSVPAIGFGPTLLICVIVSLMTNNLDTSSN